MPSKKSAIPPPYELHARDSTVVEKGFTEDAGRCKLLVGVDFGTTYSGVAYCHSSNPYFEHIETINTWPGAGTSEKTPTEIYFQTSVAPKWGFEASAASMAGSRKANSNPVYGRFKLLLDPSTSNQVYGEDLLGTSFDAGNEGAKIALPYGKTAVDLSSDYLKQLYEHIFLVLRKRLPDTLDSTPIQFIFTVPAIWSHKAQEATRQAALRAGFGKRSNDELEMISEPEAAAIYALKDIHEREKKNGDDITPQGMKVGEQFVICDAGGGTVDLITYQIEKIEPKFKLKEAVVGEGGKCGSTYIDEAFHRLLRERIGPEYENTELWTSKKKGRGSTLMKNFDIVKRSFGQSDNDCWFLELPVRVKDNEDAGIMDNEIELSKKDMAGLFDPVVDQVIQLVEAQVKKAESAANTGVLSTVILVGGFGESQYLYQKLEAWGNLRPNPLKIVNPSRSWSAVVRGAVLHGLDPAVKTRKLRSHYGIEMGLPFVEGSHREVDAYISPFDRIKRARNQAYWIASLGTDCSEDSYHSFPVQQQWDENDLRECHISILGSKFQIAPKSSKSFQVIHHGSVKVDCKNIPESAMQVKTMHGLKVYCCDFNVDMKLGSADAVFTVKKGEKEYGSFRIVYE